MMKTLLRKLCLPLLVFFIGLFSITAIAAPSENDDPQAVLKQVTDNMIQELDANKERVQTDNQFLYSLVDKILLPHADFQEMSKKVLATAWSQATPDQRERFQKEFGQLVVRTYATAFRSYKNQKVVFIDERYSPSDPNRVEIKSVIKQSGTADVPVNYRLIKEPSGEWKVYDLNVDGISLVSNFREQFAPNIRRDGLDAVIADIAAKNKGHVVGN